MKRALVVASVASMIEQFNMDNISILLELGYQVDVATNFSEPGTIEIENVNKLVEKLNEMKVGTIQINFSRGIGTPTKNIRCFKDLQKLSRNNYDLVHCQSPIGGALTRIAFKNTNSRIIYTAHGFHFYKGAPIKNWIIFYPIEKYLAKFTDTLITINEEDTLIAHRFKTPIVVKIPGVGINTQIFRAGVTETEKSLLRKNLGIGPDALVLISIGELSDRKNHITGIEAIAKLNYESYYIICGTGSLKELLRQKAVDLKVDERVIFTGYTEETEKYLSIADLSLFLSKREGLGLAGLEAMAAGVPLISTYIGGIKDCTQNGKTGFTLKNPTDSQAVSELINKWDSLDMESKLKVKSYCSQVALSYDRSRVSQIMKQVYLRDDIK